LNLTNEQGRKIRLLENVQTGLGKNMVAHTNNPSYLRGLDQKDCGLRLAQKKIETPISTKKLGTVVNALGTHFLPCFRGIVFLLGTPCPTKQFKYPQTRYLFGGSWTSTPFLCCCIHLPSFIFSPYSLAAFPQMGF
jgi:hypothetical protein